MRFISEISVLSALRGEAIGAHRIPISAKRPRNFFPQIDTTTQREAREQRIRYVKMEMHSTDTAPFHAS